MELTYSVLKKLIEDADKGNVINFPVKSTNEMVDFYLSAEQA